MDFSHLAMMTEHSLAEHIQALRRQGDRLLKWREASDTPAGRFFAGELRQLLADVREVYGRIPLGHPASAAMLARNQGEEWRLSQLLSHLETLDVSKETLDKEVAFAVQLLAKKRDTVSPTAGDIFPERVKQAIKQEK